jgi:hypothetical protein
MTKGCKHHRCNTRFSKRPKGKKQGSSSSKAPGKKSQKRENAESPEMTNLKNVFYIPSAEEQSECIRKQEFNIHLTSSYLEASQNFSNEKFCTFIEDQSNLVTTYSADLSGNISKIFTESIKLTDEQCRAFDKKVFLIENTPASDEFNADDLRRYRYLHRERDKIMADARKTLCTLAFNLLEEECVCTMRDDPVDAEEQPDNVSELFSPDDGMSPSDMSKGCNWS